MIEVKPDGLNWRWFLTINGKVYQGLEMKECWARSAAKHFAKILAEGDVR